MLLHRYLALLFASAIPSSALRDRASFVKYTRSNVTNVTSGAGQSNNTTMNCNGNTTCTPILMDSSYLTQHTADEVIKLLNLSTKPEGGYFRQISEDPPFGVPGYNYYLIRGEDGYTRYHKMDAAEAWHYYAGAPLVMVQVKSEKNKDGTSNTTISTLGPNVFQEQSPMTAVPWETWHKEISAGNWTLVKIMASTGFAQGGFKLAREGCEPVIEDC
ncbi:hypothetical protein E4U17_003203 [Claviceps sp. LM77 group G4]|nr:hypothetical protein E4U17_003203 [Claviceps sp. LM77 group G4]KAG6056506.1 hypothetical protein E4U33_007679 [Claviceps sp. LM78 group G4]KAG6066235.1 hypothetical protein E4U16_000290 [Claviceps sp. LM84 group G4]